MKDEPSVLLGTGRLLIAAIFLISGVMKIAAPAMAQSYIAAAGLPAPILAYVAAIVIEIVGGLFSSLPLRLG
jgi:putative oxidoreductase